MAWQPGLTFNRSKNARHEASSLRSNALREKRTMSGMAEGSLSRRMLLFGSALAAGGFNGRAAADEQSGIVKTKYTYKTAGCSIGADVHRKPGKQTLPVIVWIHGGALIMGDRGGMNVTQLRRYVEAGFAVASIDYRLAPETRLPDILTDVEDAHRWVHEKGPGLFQIDPDRMAVIGHSAGGYLTLTTGYRCHPRPHALVSFYGYGDIAGDWYSRPDPYYSKQPAISKEDAWAQVGQTPISRSSGGRDKFYLYTRQQGLWPRLVAGLDPDTENKAFDPYCPIRNVTHDYPPALLLHGDNDTDVPYDQSASMLRELKRNSVDCDLLTIENGGHGFDRAMDSPQVASAFDRVIRFLQQHVG